MARPPRVGIASKVAGNGWSQLTLTVRFRNTVARPANKRVRTRAGHCRCLHERLLWRNATDQVNRDDGRNANVEREMPSRHLLCILITCFYSTSKQHWKVVPM